MKAVQKAVVAALTGTVLVGFAQQASAIQVTNLGTLGAAAVSRTVAGVPKYAWDGTNGLGGPPNNNGWAHTSKWFRFTITQRSHVTISLTANGALNPALSVWKTGGAFNGDNHLSHIYNQIGVGGASQFLANGVGGDKVTAFSGYVNSGPAFKGGGGNIRHGGTCGAYVANRYARLLLNDLPPGQYLMALGGSCYTNGTATACGTGTVSTKLKITRVKPAD